MGNVLPIPAKKTLTESVKHITKKLDEKDSDFTASEDENEESSGTITEENEELEESSEDAPLVSKRKSASNRSLSKKNKYEYDSDFSVSKADLKMMKSLKKSTARLENPDYESEEEESEGTEPDDEKDEDWSNEDLSEEDIPLRKRKLKEKKTSLQGFKPRKIRGEDLSIDMNFDYQVSSS